MADWATMFVDQRRALCGRGGVNPSSRNKVCLWFITGLAQQLTPCRTMWPLRPTTQCNHGRMCEFVTQYFSLIMLSVEEPRTKFYGMRLYNPTCNCPSKPRIVTNSRDVRKLRHTPKLPPKPQRPRKLPGGSSGDNCSSNRGDERSVLATQEFVRSTCGQAHRYRFARFGFHFLGD